MARRRVDDLPLTTYGFVGNLGCIRFSAPVRKAAGIKRGDRLLVIAQDGGGVVLEKLDVPREVSPETVEVEGCACQEAPEGCRQGEPGVVTVGWSYVQLEASLATRLGLLADAPLQLVAEPGQVTVRPHDDADDLADVVRLRCPP